MPRPNLLLLAAVLLASCSGSTPARSAAENLSSSVNASASATSPAAPAASAVTDPSYRLSSGDTIAITIFDEPELASTQTIARTGEIRIPLIGEITLTGKSVREAEHALEAAYRDGEYLKSPVATLTVTSYFPREVAVLGAVRSPGTVLFPRDVTSLDIVEVITRVGGFIPISKSDAVTITRRDADGKETVTTVDLENTISGRRKAGRESADIVIYPGDRIWVPERLF
ncbi:MAG: polysaccharide biosynthesis/export family protein [Burkholderiales bacterium]|nr:polysaccharide biosynthesis/export family protein [Opitutaceae bacterium]